MGDGEYVDCEEVRWRRREEEEEERNRICFTTFTAGEDEADPEVVVTYNAALELMHGVTRAEQEAVALYCAARKPAARRLACTASGYLVAVEYQGRSYVVDMDPDGELFEMVGLSVKEVHVNGGA